jgi:hypothetical protein
MEAAMRTFEMRVYALRTKEALDFYASTVYPRHLNNFGLFGVEAHCQLIKRLQAESEEPIVIKYEGRLKGLAVGHRWVVGAPIPSPG